MKNKKNNFNRIEETESMPKRAQEQKSKILEAMPKRAQEEIVGFSMIIVIVAIIIIIFLGFSIKSPQKSIVESYEVESFLQALNQKTSDCKDSNNLDYLLVKDLIFRCYTNENCFDERKVCDVLIKEIEKVSNDSWNVGVDSAVKGYVLNMSVNGEHFKTIGYGNQTRKVKGAVQELTRNGKDFRIEFKAYY
jgi:Ni,Fe-hydrogenase I cytochrome b subunit